MAWKDVEPGAARVLKTTDRKTLKTQRLKPKADQSPSWITQNNARWLRRPCWAPAVCVKNQTKYLAKNYFIWSDQNLCCEHFDDMMDDVDLAVVSYLVHESSEQLIYHMYIKPALYKKILIFHLPIISTSPDDYFLYQHCPRLLKILCQHCPRFFTNIAQDC